MIRTARLELIPVRRPHLEAFHRGTLATLLGVQIPASWPQFPGAFALRPEAAWNGYLFVHRTEGVLVGNGGFKGPPDPSGVVEIGYEIAPSLWNRGYATEAARGLVEHAFGHAEVLAVTAHTLAATNASNHVLEKLGMERTEEHDDPRVGKVWQWRLGRPAR